MPAKRNVTKPAAKPSSKPAVAAAAKPAPVIVSKPATSGPVTDAVTPVVAKPAGHITRTVATIVAQRTNFGGLSSRDEAYFTFYAGLIRAGNGSTTVADIHASGKRPAYDGSNKPHDAGVIVRLGKAGLIATDPVGKLTLTERGKTHRTAATATA